MHPTSTRKKLTFLLLALLFMLPLDSRAQEALTLNRAVANALEQNGEILAAQSEKTSAQLELNQAARRPNPELEVETENMGRAATRLKLSQPVELGGKRQARIKRARADSQKAGAEFKIRRAAILAETHRRFYKALGHQKQIEQIDILIQFAETTRTFIERQLENGRAGKTELLRSVKDLTLLRMERNTLVREYENSIIALGALWGSAPGAIKDISGELHFVKPPLFRDSLKIYMEQSPVLQAVRAEVDASKAREATRRAEGIPGFSVTGGYLRDNEARDNRFALGAIVELPLFNRNKDAVAAARNRTAAADGKADAVRDELYATLMQRFGEIDQLEYKAMELKEKVIPQTGEVLAELRRLFEAGKSSYVELITTQRELVDAWRDYLAAETEIRLAFADIMELTGQQ
ncbi:MAG: TolC family protein [Fibrobacterota bacterium]